MKVASNLNMLGNQLIDALLHVVAGSPGTLTEGKIWYDTTADRLKYRDASTTRTPWTASGDIPVGEIANDRLTTNPLARGNHTGTQAASTISDLATVVKAYRLDEFAVPTATVDFNSQKISNLANGTAASDAVNKGQLDAAVSGLSWKQAVRVATTAAGTLATSFENGDSVDGVTLATGDRILIKNQASGGENGIYTVNASGAPTRATDNDNSAEMQGAAVMVQEGTTNANTQWVQTVDGAITIGTTATTWSQFGGGSSYTAGNGLTLSTNDFNVGAGTGISVGADTVSIDTAVVPRKYAVNVGNGSLTTITVTHSLNTLDVIVQIVEVSTGETVLADVTRTGVNAVDVTFAVAPTTNQYRVLVHG